MMTANNLEEKRKYYVEIRDTETNTKILQERIGLLDRTGDY